jgi:hypothetical protein
MGSLILSRQRFNNSQRGWEMFENEKGDYIETTPDTAQLIAMRRQNMSWHDMLGELIDNSLDAGATQIKVTFGRNATLEVSDNGIGCHDLRSMLTIGRHVHHSTTVLGQYGVGLKDVTCTLWCALQIESVRGGIIMRAVYDPPGIVKNGHWRVPLPKFGDAGDRPRGTTLRFNKIGMTPPNMQELANKIGFTFSPALRDGKQIVIEHVGKSRNAKPIVCKAYEWPLLDNKIEDAFEVDGKHVRLWCGIVKNGEPNPKYGFTLMRGHRVIRDNEVLGAEGYAMSHVVGCIDLDGSWSLTKNKNDISNEEKARLRSEVRLRCISVFERASMIAKTLKIDGLTKEVQSRIGNLIIGQTKGCERHTSRGGCGTHGRGTGKKRRRRASDI